MEQIKKITFKGYKVFPDKNYTCMDGISRVNVIIGKNNSGKTSLLDVVELIYDVNTKTISKNSVTSVGFTIPIDKSISESIFEGFSSIGGWSEKSFYEAYGEKNISLELESMESLKLSYQDTIRELLSYMPRGISAVENRRRNYRFRKISAERNIYPEAEDKIYLESTGEGASNLIRKFLNDSAYDESVIEHTLLEALNEIMMPESEFESIRVQQIRRNGQNLWEVYLQEKGMQRVPLSKTGSGLKTIVLVLLNLLVMPQTNEYNYKKIVYGFEELENNLHPALQRRLFEFLYQYATEQEVTIYITTHSHIAINAFFDKDDAAIYHVVKKDGQAEIKRIDTYIDKTEILNDLDVKASDILQSNGIIWVEGPSDRIYIKRWLELFTPNEYEEGKHYQFLYYGGRLLAQYSAEEATELISIITTNRNAAIVIDSDKRYRSEQINPTKKRILQECDDLNMFSWVTKGKEIENYLPKEALEKMQDVSIADECGQFELYPDYVGKYYKNFSQRKVPFANKIKQYITYDNSVNILNLKKQIKNLYEQIAKWNE